MNIERALRRAIGIIMQKPANYDQIGDIHEEIWDTDVDEIWDGEREFNLDEVPWLVVQKEKQITERGEIARLAPGPLKQHISKYRQGTIVLFVNCFGIILVLLIIKKGKSEQVTKQVQKLKKNCCSRLHVFLSESGSMTQEIWPKAMNLFKNATSQLRECRRRNGTDWKKTVVLNIDNFIVHLNKAIAEEYANNYGIYIRCLARNGSHLQQPVDQNIGKIFKNLFKRFLLEIQFTLDNLDNLGLPVQVKTRKWRELVIRLMDQTLKEMSKPYYDYLFLCAWINYGIYIDLKGTQDGEESSLHQSTLTAYQRCHTEKERIARRERHTNEMLSKVVLRKRKRGNFSIKRPPHLINIQYSIEEANRNSYVPRKKTYKEFQDIQIGLQNINKSEVQELHSIFKQDLSDPNLKIPTQPQYVRAYDVICLQSIYAEQCINDVKKQKELCTKHLQIPFVNQNGQLISMPLSS
ncbi:MAG: hypothetical protein GY941_29435 [Planctomycetes bacterium]|nr:hypothetical protein [Planctomycetota bacterium]